MWKKILYINSGHSLSQPGAVSALGEKEADITIKIRDEVIPLLQGQGFEVQIVPDYLDLASSIYWVNQRAKNLDDGFCLEIHLNAGGGQGAEAFYYTGDKEAKNFTNIFINAYCKETGFLNRGAKPDNQSAVGKLGWIRDTNTRSLLIECGFIDNPDDLKKIKDFKKTAMGIAKGICEIYGVYFVIGSDNKELIKAEIIKLLNQL